MVVDNEDTRFATAMRRQRERMGMNQSDLARRLRESGLANFHPTTVSRIENSERPVRLSEAAAIARVLETDVVSMMKPHVEVAQKVVDAITDLRETESAIWRGLTDYQAARSGVQYSLVQLDEWEADNPDLAAKPANKLVIDELRTTASEFLRRSATDVMRECEDWLHEAQSYGHEPEGDDA